MNPPRLWQPGPRNDLTDVTGLRVGHATLTGDGRLSGVTVVRCPPGGAVAGVAVRGGGPGTRETDVLGPTTAAPPVHAVCLCGSSAFGLAAADGVARDLLAEGVGLPVTPGVLVPIVPAAVVFDLGRGGSPLPAVDADAGRTALAACSADRPVALGSVGAGTGALAGGLRGGVGSASIVVPVPDGSVTVGALLVVNAAGSPVSAETGRLYAEPFLLPADSPPPAAPSAADLAANRDLLDLAHRHPALRHGAALNTTIGVVGVDGSLTPAQATKLAEVSHDGLARALRPVHAMTDGDAIFALATGSGPGPDPLVFHDLLTAAADVVARAVARAVLNATLSDSPEGSWPGYREAFPSVYR